MDSKAKTTKVKKPVPDSIKKAIHDKKEWIKDFQNGKSTPKVDKTHRFA
ncbi:MAG: hypothetical protein M3Q56_07310 [Bacteroidota bacterium]|nr:hypothetical protein [Bacteroidota bacterium]